MNLRLASPPLRICDCDIMGAGGVGGAGRAEFGSLRSH